jgi:hypothetical protein
MKWRSSAGTMPLHQPQAHFVHVYVSRSTGQSVDVSHQARSLLQGLMVAGSVEQPQAVE